MFRIKHYLQVISQWCINELSELITQLNQFLMSVYQILYALSAALESNRSFCLLQLSVNSFLHFGNFWENEFKFIKDLSYLLTRLLLFQLELLEHGLNLTVVWIARKVLTYFMTEIKSYWRTCVIFHVVTYESHEQYLTFFSHRFS